MTDNTCFDVEEARTLISDARYEIETFIGDGAMACVYRVREVGTPNLYALKLLREEYSKRSRFLDFFEREANHMRDLQYPNIVRFYKFVREEKSAYILMDYVEGKPLTHFVRETRETGIPIDIPKIVRIIAQVARALNYIHREGFIHRDVKPGNILLAGENESAFLTDLGILGAINLDDPALRGAGTPSYMPYEQQTGGQVNNTVDIYAFGIMLYELFTGEKPFLPETGLSFKEARKAVIELHRKAPIPSLSEKRPDLPPEIDAIFERALAKTKEERYGDALEFAQDIHEVLLPQLPPDMQNFESIRASEMQRSGQVVVDEDLIKKRDYGVIIAGVALLVVIAAIVAGAVFFNNQGAQANATEIFEEVQQQITETQAAATDTPSPSPMPSATSTPEPTITPSPTMILDNVQRMVLAEDVAAIGYGNDLDVSVNYIASVRDGFVPLQTGGSVNGFRVELTLEDDYPQYGIAFRIQDEHSYLLFSINADDSTWKLEAIVPDSPEMILREGQFESTAPTEIALSAEDEFIRIEFDSEIIEAEYETWQSGMVALWFPIEEEQQVDMQSLQIDLIGTDADLVGQVSEIDIAPLSPLYFVLEDVGALVETANVNAIVNCMRFTELHTRMERHAEHEMTAEFANEIILLSAPISNGCRTQQDNTEVSFSLSDINRWQAGIDEFVSGLEEISGDE